MSVGSLVGTALLECIEAIGRDRFELMGMNSEAGAVNNFRIDTCYLSPPAVRHDALFALLDRIVATHAPHLVVPGRDDDVVALAHWAHDRKYAHALAGAPAIADVLRDKWTSFRWAQARGLPFARSAIDLDACRRLVADEGFPVIAKPRKGFASNGVRLVWNDDQLRVALAAGDPVVQQAIDPAPALAAEAIAGGMPLWYAPVQAGSPLGLCVLDEAGCRFVASWRSSHVRGAAFDTSLMQDPQLEALSLRYGHAAWQDGWRGLLSLQVRKTADGAWMRSSSPAASWAEPTRCIGSASRCSRSC